MWAKVLPISTKYLQICVLWTVRVFSGHSWITLQCMHWKFWHNDMVVAIQSNPSLQCVVDLEMVFFWSSILTWEWLITRHVQHRPHRILLRVVNIFALTVIISIWCCNIQRMPLNNFKLQLLLRSSTNWISLSPKWPTSLIFMSKYLSELLTLSLRHFSVSRINFFLIAIFSLLPMNVIFLSMSMYNFENVTEHLSY